MIGDGFKKENREGMWTVFKAFASPFKTTYNGEDEDLKKIVEEENKGKMGFFKFIFICGGTLLVMIIGYELLVSWIATK